MYPYISGTSASLPGPRNDLETAPELLGHHYTEARQPEKAIPLWQKAGSLALRGMALIETIAQLNKGRDLVAALPASAERDRSELDLRTLLGTAWIALKGWPAQEVWDSLHPALRLANALRRNDALVPILWGLFIHVLGKGRAAESLRWVTELMNAAETYRDPKASAPYQSGGGDAARLPRRRAASADTACSTSSAKISPDVCARDTKPTL
jgi:hypothetical protein